jgi:cytochrome c
MSWMLVGVISIGAALAIAATVLMWQEIISAGRRIGRRAVPVVALITCTVMCMGYGRHIYRETAVSPHRNLMARKTADFAQASSAAAFRARAGLESDAALPLGERIFKNICAACHAPDRVLAGPSLREIRDLYHDNPAGIVAWAKSPGRKRPELIPMPAFRLPQHQLEAVAGYMLKSGTGHTRGDPQPPAPTD